MFLDSFRSVTGLHDRVRESLSREFGGELDHKLGQSAADAVIEQGDKVAVVEVSLGEPGFSLPSSTSARMRLLSDEAGKQFQGKEVLPVLLTNYHLSEEQKDQMDRAGIKVVLIAGSGFEPNVISTLEKIGFTPKSERSPSGQVWA